MRVDFPALLLMVLLTACSHFERFNLTSLGSRVMSREFKDRQPGAVVKWVQPTWKTFFGSFSSWGGGEGEGGGSLLKYPHVSESRGTPKSHPGHMVPILVSWPRVKTVHVVKLTFHIWLAHFQSEFANEWMNVLTGLQFLGEPSLHWTWRRIKAGFEKCWCSPKHSMLIEFWSHFYLLWNKML